MAKNDKKDTKQDVTDYQRRSGTGLPEQPVTNDTDIEPKGKDNEILMPTREGDANIERARKLADENSQHDRADREEAEEDVRGHKVNDTDVTRSDI